MPSYYNPYQFYQPAYMPQASYTNMPVAPVVQQAPVQASYATGPNCAMAWVDGEIEARGRQMPQGATQFAMWDTNKQVIYLKSLNPMGMPNPMQILHYTMEEQQNNLPAGQSGSSPARDENGNEMGARFGPSGAAAPDMSQYVTKEDLNQMKAEIRNMLASQNNQNSSGSNQNGSGNSNNHGISGTVNNSGANGNRGGNR